MTSNNRFTDKIVVVTGASSGIGSGIARRFTAEGAQVVIAARRLERLEHLRDELGTDKVLAVQTDVTNSDQMHEMVSAAVDRFGGLDVLVSNAGVGYLKPFEQIPVVDWQMIMATNLDSCFYGAQAAAPHLRVSKGNIVHIASASGLGGDRGMSPYNAAKAAVINFARSLAFDLGPAGVRVNVVAPALTLDPDADPQKGFDVSTLVAKFNERRALPGVSTPADVAAAVAFLASSDARFITGAVLPVDGGVTASSGQPSFL